jgi:hypothetical protein
MEQAVEQSVSTYSAASGSVTTASGTVTFACAKGGTGTYDQTETGGKVCWESTLSGCEFSNSNGGTLKMSGSTKMCASEVPADDDLETLADSGTVEFSGSYSVSGTVGGVSIPARTCDYSYTGTLDYYTKDTLDCATATLTGSIDCGIADSKPPANYTVDFCVEAEVTVETSS